MHNIHEEKHTKKFILFELLSTKLNKAKYHLPDCYKISYKNTHVLDIGKMVAVSYTFI